MGQKYALASCRSEQQEETMTHRFVRLLFVCALATPFAAKAALEPPIVPIKGKAAKMALMICIRFVSFPPLPPKDGLGNACAKLYQRFLGTSENNADQKERS